ncbi:MAG TPA: TonB-dependent receptor, partial [Saprospiraceae bacterium]|nr:TonB-dependent receptor [Saprospiraceae bacterium]
LGVGTSNSDEDYSVKDNFFKRDMHFKTGNIAFYLENMFQITDKWLISPGLRFESGHSDFSGKITYLDDIKVPNKIEHEYVLGGLSTKYKLSSENIIHAGFSQAYRPIVLKDIIPETVQEASSNNLKDVTGYNAEIGINGRLSPSIKYDLTFFRLTQDNRMGSITIPGVAGNDSLYYKTNIGNSVTNGIEFYMQWKIFQNSNTTVSIFTSTSYMDARYTDGEFRDVNDKNINKSLKDKKVETVPDIISRNGLELAYKKFSMNILYSYTAECYADAFNTVNPNKSGTIGLIPSYGLLDAGISYFISDMIKLKLNVSNILDKQYYTKRPVFYPGPGIWSSDGRSAQVTFQVKI